MTEITLKEAGIKEKNIADFVEETRNICLHSFLMLRRNKVFAEGEYGGITPKIAQRLYSVSKTFTGAAIGMLEYEGKISTDARIAEIWGVKPKHKWIADMTVRDCLRMETCHNGTTYKLNDTDWVSSFFESQPTHPPGTIFRYDTSAAHVLSATAEKISKMRLMDYLRVKMGLSAEADCIKAPDGYSWGGSGVIANLYDMAKLGELYMNFGILNGKRLLGKDFAREAVIRQTDTDMGFGYPCGYGYGYQMWITEYGYVFYGIGSQDVFCFPNKDFMFVCTADTMGEAAYGKLLETALIRNVVNNLDKTEGEDVFCPTIVRDFPVNDGVNEHSDGKGLYELEENPMGIKSMELDYENGRLVYDTPRGRRILRFGQGKYIDAVFPETHYFGRQIGVSAERGYRCRAAGVWVEYNKLRIKVWLLDDHTGGVNITLVYKADEIAVCMKKHGQWYLDEYNGFVGGKRQM